MTTTNKVIVVVPKELAGRTATRNGSPFRYPSQRFWVHPVILDGETEGRLVLAVKEVPVNSEDGADYINGFLQEKIVLKMNPTIVYDFHTLLATATCPSCGHSLDWTLSHSTDKFCIAECCGMQYGMVPQTVRVISVPVAAIKPPPAEDPNYADDDFLRELQNM